MARQAKDVEQELPDRVVNKAVKDILDHYASIETARGRFMNSARKERDAMTAIYETIAQRGVAQKIMKTEIKIVRAFERIKGWLSELEEDERKMVQALAKAQNDKQQLTLFGDPDAKPERKARKPREGIKLVHPQEEAASA